MLPSNLIQPKKQKGFISSFWVINTTKGNKQQTTVATFMLKSIGRLKSAQEEAAAPIAEEEIRSGGIDLYYLPGLQPQINKGF